MQLSTFLGAPPDGRPLYRYRLSDGQYDTIRDAVRRELRAGRTSPAVDALLCVFTAEWWRREHDGGPWAWRPVQRAAGAGDVTWSAWTGALEHGLHVLKRPLLHRDRGDRAFLVTLVCEGGFPLRLLRRPDVRTHCRAVLEHLAESGMTGEEPPEALEAVSARYDACLPPLLQRDLVHRLVGELVGRAWALQPRIPPNERDPVAALDRDAPGWRDVLPVVVSDDAAHALLRGLIGDVTEVARAGGRLRVRCELRLGDHDAQLRRSLALPATFGADRLRELLGVDVLPDASRLLLTLRAESGDTVRAAALARAGEDTWASQPLGRAGFVGRSAEGLVSVLVTARGELVAEVVQLDGASPLGALPWTFRPGGDGGWELVAVGSVRRREPELLVAVAPGDTVVGGEPLGVAVGERRLLRVCGEVEVHTEDGLVRVSAAQPVADTGTYTLHGAPFERVTSPRTAWRGLPRLVRVEGSRVQPVPLEVRADGGWRAADPADVGDLRVRAHVGGELVFSAAIRVVPADLEVRLRVGGRGQPGGLSFRSAALLDAQVPPGDGYRAVRSAEPDGIGFTVEATGAQPPPVLPVTLYFDRPWPPLPRSGGEGRGEGARSRLTGHVPFPAATARFQGPDDRALPAADVHVERLGGIRAVGLSPRPGARFRLTLSTSVKDPALTPRQRNFDVAAQPSGEHRLDLRDVQAAIGDLLDATEDLDAVVRVSLWEVGAGGLRAELLVRRYDWTLERDEAEGDVLLHGPAPDRLAEVVVEASPFAEIGAVEVLPQVPGQARWRFDPASRAAGSWLITAREAGWTRCRALPFSGTGTGTPPAGLRAAFELPKPAERRAAIDERLDEMVSDWAHPDWPVVDAFLRRLGALPAATFDLVRAVAAHPRAAAVAALRVAAWAPADRIEVVEGFDELVFLWEAVPLVAWMAGFDLLYAALAPAGPEVARDEVVARAVALAEPCPTVPVALHHWARRARIDVPPAPAALQIEATFCAAAAPMLLAHRTHALQELLRARADVATWPNGRRAPPEVVRELLVDPQGQPPGRRTVLDAPVWTALACVGELALDRPTTLTIEECRSFSRPYFHEVFLTTLYALLARRPPGSPPLPPGEGRGEGGDGRAPHPDPLPDAGRGGRRRVQRHGG